MFSTAVLPSANLSVTVFFILALSFQSEPQTILNFQIKSKYCINIRLLYLSIRLLLFISSFPNSLRITADILLNVKWFKMLLSFKNNPTRPGFRAGFRVKNVKIRVSGGVALRDPEKTRV